MVVLQILVAGLALGSIYALIAVGFAMYLRSMRLLNFSHGEVTMVGAGLGTFVYVGLGLPYALGFFVVIGATAVVGLLLERIVFRPLWARAHDPFMVNTVFATIAVGILLTNVALKLGGADPIRVPAPLGDAPLDVMGIRIVPHYVLVLAMTVVLVTALQVFFQRTSAGLAMRAVMQDRDTASLMGVRLSRSIAWTFAIASALGGAAGYLVAPVVFWSFGMGGIGIKAFAGLTLGGLYSFPGAIFGGLLIGLLETFTGAYLSSTYRDAIVYASIIVMLLLKPEGLLAGARGLARVWRRSDEPQPTVGAGRAAGGG